MSDIMNKNIKITENNFKRRIEMKKGYSVIFILLAFILTIGCFSGFTKTKAFADEQNTSLSAKSKTAYLMDYDTKTVIYSKNETQRLPIASMCKIMTLLLCFESIDDGTIAFDDIVVVSDNASGMGGSQVFLETNGEYLVGELIKSIVVASANDACVAMAEKLYGSESEMVSKMNARSAELGMENTNFVNCTGLPQPGQYSCSKDVATMFAELLTHEDYFRFSKIWTDVVSHPKDRKTEISNTNKLIRFYKGCDSGKTGYTSEAGHCLSASAVRNGMRLISVVISAPDSKTRFNDVSSMFNYGFANYVNKIVVDNRKPLNLSVKVDGGKKDCIEVVAEKPVYLFTKRNEQRSVEVNFCPINRVCAPVNIGDKVGELKIYENGIEIDSVAVLANETVAEKTYFDIIRDIGENWALI